MRWLIDEMLPSDVAAGLRERGHDARAAVDDLRALTDEQLLDVAVAEDRVLVTENVVDFVALLSDRLASSGDAVPVVFVLKSNLPSEPRRLGSRLSSLLDKWANDHPGPFPTAYWL